MFVYFLSVCFVCFIVFVVVVVVVVVVFKKMIFCMNTAKFKYNLTDVSNQHKEVQIQETMITNKKTNKQKKQ